MSSKNQNLTRKWKRWLRTIRTEIIALAQYRQVYRDIQEIIRNNPSINVENEFYDLIGTGYATYASVTVRKLTDPLPRHKHKTDRPPRSISLHILLEDILKNPRVLSRRRILSLLLKPYYPARRVHGDIDKTGKMGSAYISRAKVRHDLFRLSRTSKRIRRYVNKVVAHRNRVPLRSLPTFSDLDDAIDCLQEIIKPYIFLITGSSLAKIIPTVPDDWTKILKVPWIKGR